MANERIPHPSSISRRDLFKAGASALAGTTVLGALNGCGGFSDGIGLVTDRYTLDVQFRDLIIGGRRCRLRCYNGQVPGPTMRTAPGHRFHVRVENGLPPNKPAAMGEGGGGGHVMGRAHPGESVFEQNTPHMFNTTNLHVHGLQVSTHLFQPFGTADPMAPLLAIEPGEAYEYKFVLPEDHPSGLFFYHPHFHGSTLLQVVNGMAGAIIVEGPIDHVPEIAAARDIPIYITDLGLCPSPDDPNLWQNDPTPGKYFNSQTGTPLDGYMLGNYMIQTFLVNGQPVFEEDFTTGQQVNVQLPVPSVSMQPGEVVRLRILNGTSDSYMPINIEDHTMHVIALDGINFLAPRPSEYDPSEQQLPLASANRGEVLIKGGAPGRYRLYQPAHNEQFGPSPEKHLMDIVVEGNPIDMALPTSLPKTTREYPLPSQSPVNGFNSIQFKVTFPYNELPTGVGFFLNNLLYDEFRVDHYGRIGDVEEWTLTNVSGEGHPFHIHVNSFELISIGGIAVEPGTFKDVQWVRPNQPVVFRMRYKQFTGKTVYHCHILPHEDTGMMQNFIIRR